MMPAGNSLSLSLSLSLHNGLNVVLLPLVRLTSPLIIFAGLFMSQVPVLCAVAVRLKALFKQTVKLLPLICLNKILLFVAFRTDVRLTWNVGNVKLWHYGFSSDLNQDARNLEISYRSVICCKLSLSRKDYSAIINWVYLLETPGVTNL